MFRGKRHTEEGHVSEVGFTAGVTLNDGTVFTVDVEALDDHGIRYRAEEEARLIAWTDVKAVMLATSDHMLEMSGYIFSVAEMIGQREQSQPYEPTEMRRFALGLLAEAAPRLCPLGEGCPLATRSSGDGD